MKTQAILDKYRKIICGLLKCETVIFETLPQTGPHGWEEIGSIEKIPDKPDLEKTWCLGNYRLKIGMTPTGGAPVIAASWQLYQLPHCCAICVSCKAFVDPQFRGRRLGTVLNSLRQEIARALGYSLLMCTDITKNEHQRKLLKTQGWQDIYEVYNKRTTNNVVVSVINI